MYLLHDDSVVQHPRDGMPGTLYLATETKPQKIFTKFLGEVNAIQAARGLTGMWHFTTGKWADKGHLLALCGRKVGSHHREFTRDSVDCRACNRKNREGSVVLGQH